jgi:hypothetical protein
MIPFGMQLCRLRTHERNLLKLVSYNEQTSVRSYRVIKPNRLMKIDVLPVQIVDVFILHFTVVLIRSLFSVTQNLCSFLRVKDKVSLVQN